MANCLIVTVMMKRLRGRLMSELCYGFMNQVSHSELHDSCMYGRYRKQVALAAITDAKQMWLTHFSNVDMQGHCCGVTLEWNKDDTYTVAVNNNTVQQTVRSCSGIICARGRCSCRRSRTPVHPTLCLWCWQITGTWIAEVMVELTSSFAR